MAEVIASVLGRTATEIHRRVRLAAMAGADWIELRLDGLKQKVEPKELLEKIHLPVLICCRLPRDGGCYEGSPDQRRELFRRYLVAGAEGLDLEDWEDWSPKAESRPRLLVRSHHNLKGVSDDLAGRRDQLLGTGADVAKIAVTAPDLADSAPLLELLACTDQLVQPTVAFAMGVQAWPSRVLACLFGAPYVYGSPAPGLEVAPGQVSVEQLCGIYRARSLSSATLVYGVLGNPASHSLGPWLFNRCFRLLSHDGLYLPLTTSRPETVLGMLPRRRLRGLSVTAPHKGRVAGFCHELDQASKQACAANTLTFEAHGAVIGHNTDVLGVQEALRQAGLTAAEGAPAVVLGGGGAARAAALALMGLGMKVTMMPRSLDPVREFAKAMGLQLARMDAALLCELQPRAVVHATPVGGLGDPGGGAGKGKRLLPEWQPRPGTYVLDMVYRPRRTKLLSDVQAAGGIPVPGMEMFLHQAAEQVYLFTGERIPAATLGQLLVGS